jgi:hypothetical protein
MSTQSKAQVTNVKRANGVAGEIAVSGLVTYPGEDARWVTFVGSAYGGAPVMIMGRNRYDRPQSFVREPSRFGTFEADPVAWFHSFFA